MHAKKCAMKLIGNPEASFSAGILFLASARRSC
jgi:hypothetical protein